MLYGTECWAVNQHENILIKHSRVVEMMMLHWMCSDTRQDKIKHDNIREGVGVAAVVEKMVEDRLG